MLVPDWDALPTGIVIGAGIVVVGTALFGTWWYWNKRKPQVKHAYVCKYTHSRARYFCARVSYIRVCSDMRE